MSDPFLAEIRAFPYNFAPKGWAFCDGQLMPLSQNTALFALLGTTYGGDGKSTFALPNLQGRAPMHPGQGAGLSVRDLGEQGGTATVTLLQSEMTFHAHDLRASFDDGDLRIPGPGRSFARSGGGNLYASNAGTHLDAEALKAMGGGQPHNNMQPYLVLNFCIALQGIFPPRG